ncbi:uncharacterized protein UTRI_05183_B [Ustilago trichophora]|uniref:BRCT domain-containing protein n=1 Tax=Ustilago trichophora TaxID=86804 RepID=A0A5C3EPL3_9BASI|nr:uncharacterized protein UTRI_05183_B [Ustilago trichophora]
MHPPTEDTDFVEPALRQPQANTSHSQSQPTAAAAAAAAASTSHITHSTTTLQSTRIELLSESDTDARPSNNAASIQPDPQVGVNPSASSTPTKPKIFLKSSSPDIPLHIHLPSELSYSLTRKLEITIRAHGGVRESRFGKADLIVVDPQMLAVSKRTLRDANKMGQPIPVVTLDYIHDSVAQGHRQDVDHPKYKFDAIQPNPSAAANTLPPSRSSNARNPFTAADRQAIIDYFIDKQQASWSLNAAAKQLAARNPTHSYASYQSYLQANFDKGWNLKDEVLKARTAALEAEPSALQARILRSQYTASPGLAEQSAPSDGWPRTSPEPQDDDQERQAAPQPSRQNSPQTSAADEETSPAREHDDDLMVRQPNPGATLQDVQRSPTKIRQPVDYAPTDSSRSSPSPRAFGSRHPSIEPPPGQRTSVPRSPSVDEESDPEDYSPTILSQIQRQQSSHLKPSQKAKQGRRRTSHSSDSDSSVDSQLDQLEHNSDEDLLATGPLPNAPEAQQHGDDDSDDPEWEGSRLQDRKMRERDTTVAKENRVKFTQGEKDTLLNQLARYVHEQGRETHASTQEAMLAKPDDAFWERFALDNPTHSAISWRSHYLKNRPTYRQMIELLLDDMNDESAEEQDDSQVPGAANSSTDTPNGAEAESRQPDASPDDGQRSNEMSLPADGIVVLIPCQPVEGNDHRPRREPQSQPEQLWTAAPSPPPMEGEEEEERDTMQVEAEIDALVIPPESIHFDIEEEVPALQHGPQVSRDDASVHELESLKEPASVANVDAEAEPSPQPDRGPVATPPHPVPERRTRPVDAGTPVLARHRDAPFYDFTIDSDEEQRIRKARSRPSLPNMQTRQEATSPRPPRSPITTDRVLGHFATPSRNQRPTTTRPALASTRAREDERIQRTREWARSVSASPSSASPDLLQSTEPAAVAEPSRARARRIDHTPRLSSGYASKLSPQLQRGLVQQSRRISSERTPTALPASSASPARARLDQASVSRERRPSKSGIEAARLQYRAEVERFRNDFGLDKEQLRALLMRFKANVKDARDYIAFWLGEMEEAYGADADVAFEYVKTAQGDFEQAETFLKLASSTRSRSAQNPRGAISSRSVSHSVSPVKRRARNDDRSFSRIDREGGRGELSKRSRR